MTALHDALLIVRRREFVDLFAGTLTYGLACGAVGWGLCLFMLGRR